MEYLEFPKSNFTETGIRVDSGVIEGDQISVHYDPMLAKIVAWGSTRQDAIRRLDKAIKQSHIGGIESNLGLIRCCLNHADFLSDEGVSTHFIEQNMNELLSALSRLETTEEISISGKDDDTVAIRERLLTEYYLKVFFYKKN